MDHEQQVNDVLNRAFWDAEDQRLKPLIDFIGGLPGVVGATGGFIGGLPDRGDMDCYSPECWSVMFRPENNRFGWATLGVLVGIINKSGHVAGRGIQLSMSAPCPCCNANAWEELAFWMDGATDPGVVLDGFEKAFGEVKYIPRERKRNKRGRR